MIIHHKFSCFSQKVPLILSLIFNIIAIISVFVYKCQSEALACLGTMRWIWFFPVTFKQVLGNQTQMVRLGQQLPLNNEQSNQPTIYSLVSRSLYFPFGSSYPPSKSQMSFPFISSLLLFLFLKINFLLPCFFFFYLKVEDDKVVPLWKKFPFLPSKYPHVQKIMLPEV